MLPTQHPFYYLFLTATYYKIPLTPNTFLGLQIIYTKDEVDFIQNLVFYIETSYRTPVSLFIHSCC